MEIVNWSKLDRGLRRLYRDWVDDTISPDTNTSLTVTLEHNGQLNHATLADNGFNVTGKMSGTCFQGDVLPASIPQLSQIEDVTLISFGTESSINLEHSHESVQVQASSASLTDGVWHFNTGTDTFSGNTGSGAVVGIIDTGIDFNHPCFQNTAGTETRIHAIWDQFLTPRSTENSPAATLLATGSTTSYGVEYLKANIDNNPSDVRHEDNNGHGTHVAGIAAGNGSQNTGTSGSRSANIGIAPEARIIVVKLLNPCSTGSSIGFGIRERDAFHYILKKSAELFGQETPVVINCSYSDELQPHDGRGWEGAEYIENHLHAIFNGVSGKICVAGTANSAGTESHLKLTLPATPNGAVDLPFTIFDDRSRCIRATDMEIEVVYPETVDNVRGWIKLPGLGQFFGGDAPGATSGTELNEEYDGVYGSARHRVLMNHYNIAAQSPYGNVARRNLALILRPRRRRHHSGNFVFRVGGPPGSVLHLWVRRTTKHLRIVFDRTALLATTGVDIENKSTIGSPGQSPDVISVGAYEVNSGGTPFVTSFSSRGPLVAYDGNPVIDDLPHVVAPGFQVHSANNNALARAVSPSGHYVSKSGTSMASPHITGLVALMLNKNATLTKQQILNAFSDSQAPPFSVPDLHHDPTPDYNRATYVIPAVNPPLPGHNEAGIGRILYKDVLAQITAIP